MNDAPSTNPQPAPQDAAPQQTTKAAEAPTPPIQPPQAAQPVAPPTPPAPPAASKPPFSALVIAAFLLGLIGAALSMFPIANIGGVLLGALGFILAFFGCIATARKKRRGLVLAVISLVLCAGVCLFSIGTAFAYHQYFSEQDASQAAPSAKTSSDAASGSSDADGSDTKLDSNSVPADDTTTGTEAATEAKPTEPTDAPASTNAEAETAEPTAEAEDAATASGDIDPEFKACLDEYEAFMDEYFAFMQKYAEAESTGDYLSMMNDYASILSQYSEWAKTINGLDQNAMTDAEAAYYLEVQARVTQKAAEAAVELEQ